VTDALLLGGRSGAGKTSVAAEMSTHLARADVAAAVVALWLGSAA
jgi:anion-transporting  ArsA/GET3 family ATPase